MVPSIACGNSFSIPTKTWISFYAEQNAIAAANSLGEVLNADLSGANLFGAVLNRVNLSGASLLNANLRGANLFGANLNGADLSGANLLNASLASAIDLKQTQLEKACGQPRALPDYFRAGFTLPPCPR